MRVVQVSFHADPLRRDPDHLLEAWPTLGAVAAASARAGVETVVVQAAAADAERVRDDVRYIFVREPAPTRLHRKLGYWTSPGGSRTARRAVAESAGVLHVHGLGFPRQLEWLEGTAPILIQDHGDQLPPRWAARFWRRGLRHASAVAFTAREQATPFIDAGLLAPGTAVFEVLESSTTFTPGNRAEARLQSGIHGDPCCLWLGRLDGNKDPLTVLDAFERAVSFLPGARLWVCWRDGALESAVRRRVRISAALRERVHLIGALSHADVEKALRAADFLLQASHREGSGYAVMEALACGTTPIVTDIPSFRRITGGGSVGALVPTGDAAAIAAALRLLSLRDPVELRTLARRHFEEHLAFDAVGRQLAAAYAAMLR